MGERDRDKGRTERVSEAETQRKAERNKWGAEEKARETQTERDAGRETQVPKDKMIGTGRKKERKERARGRRGGREGDKHTVPV